MTDQVEETIPAAAESEEETQEIAVASDNPAVRHCIESFNEQYKATWTRKQNAFESERSGERAFRRAMPPLDSPSNISNFVACIAYGILTDIFLDTESTRLLYAAQVAASSSKRTSKPSRSVAKE